MSLCPDLLGQAQDKDTQKYSWAIPIKDFASPKSSSSLSPDRQSFQFRRLRKEKELKLAPRNLAEAKFGRLKIR